MLTYGQNSCTFSTPVADDHFIIGNCHFFFFKKSVNILVEGIEKLKFGPYKVKIHIYVYNMVKISKGWVAVT